MTQAPIVQRSFILQVSDAVLTFYDNCPPACPHLQNSTNFIAEISQLAPHSQWPAEAPMCTPFYGQRSTEGTMSALWFVSTTVHGVHSS